MTMEEPFEGAVERHGATVLRVCRALLGPGPDADDAWSETFLSALRAWPGLPEDTNVQAWLVRVAQRKAIDITRARSRHAVPTAQVPEPPSDTGPDTGPAAPDLDEHGLWRAVAALPTRQRLAIAHHYLGGLSHVETAELIGGTPASVRRAASDGIRTLRRVLGAAPLQEGTSR